MLDEVGQPASRLEQGLAGRVLALVGQNDLDSPGEEGELLQAFRQDLPLVHELLEDLGIGPECDDGARLVGRLPLAEPALGPASLELLVPYRAVPGHLDGEASGKGV